MTFTEAKRSKNKFRRDLRTFLKVNRADWLASTDRNGNKPYAELTKYFTVEWLRWNPANETVLLRVRDSRAPITNYDSDLCRYVMVRTYSYFAFRDFWTAANDVACNMQIKK